MGCGGSRHSYAPYDQLPLLAVQEAAKQQEELHGKPVQLVGRAMPGPCVLLNPFIFFNNGQPTNTKALIMKVLVHQCQCTPQGSGKPKAFLCAIGAVEGFYLQHQDAKVWVDLSGESRQKWRLAGPLGGRETLDDIIGAREDLTGNLAYSEEGHKDLPFEPDDDMRPCLMMSEGSRPGSWGRWHPISVGMDWWDAFSGDSCNECGKQNYDTGMRKKKSAQDLKKDGFDKDGKYPVSILQKWADGMEQPDLKTQEYTAVGLTEMAMKPGNLTSVCGIFKLTEDYGEKRMTLVPELPGGDISDSKQLVPGLSAFESKVPKVDADLAMDEKDWIVEWMHEARWAKGKTGMK